MGGVLILRIAFLFGMSWAQGLGFRRGLDNQNSLFVRDIICPFTIVRNLRNAILIAELNVQGLLSSS